MTAASQELTSSVFKSLANDTSLVTLLGGPKIFDRLPEKLDPPYAVLGAMTCVDWSTATEGGEAHTFTIHVWSNSSDRRECQALLAKISSVLKTDLPDMPNHHLVHLREQFSETRRDRLAEYFHSFARFRGVTEPKT